MFYPLNYSRIYSFICFTNSLFIIADKNLKSILFDKLNEFKTNKANIIGKTIFNNFIEGEEYELEHLDCLVTLCGDCHSKVHKYHIKL